MKNVSYTKVPSIELNDEEKIYVELDNGKKVSIQNCTVIFLVTGDIQILRRVGEKLYNSLYYKEHIINYTLTLDIEHGAETYEQH